MYQERRSNGPRIVVQPRSCFLKCAVGCFHTISAGPSFAANYEWSKNNAITRDVDDSSLLVRALKAHLDQSRRYLGTANEAALNSYINDPSGTKTTIYDQRMNSRSLEGRFESILSLTLCSQFRLNIPPSPSTSPATWQTITSRKRSTRPESTNRHHRTSMSQLHPYCQHPSSSPLLG